MTVYHCIDIETTGRTWATGEILTIGCVSLDTYGELIREFYVRVQHLDDDGQPCHTWEHLDAWNKVETETLEWWKEQDEAIRDEALEDRTLVRHPIKMALRMLVEHVYMCGDGPHIFVASPVGFDQHFIFCELDMNDVPNPFHYRAIDVRSAAWGKDPKRLSFADLSRSVTSFVPHHALHDARALASELRDLLR